MGEIISNKFVTIKHHIDGAPKEEDFELITANISISSIEADSSNFVLVKCLHVSIDPYQLNRMKEYSPSQNSIYQANKLVPGKPINGAGIGKVMVSRHPEFQKDDIVSGMLSWANYVMVEDVKLLKKLDPMGFPLSYHVGILGACGLAAYAGFISLSKPKKGERVFVSTASGAVGNIVGQYAKLLGCYVVGCAGTPEKVALLKEKLGFDDAFNYKEESDFNLALKRYFPEGIDIYFDNVGGEMLEAAVANMNTFGRVAVCGVISQYTDLTGRRAAPDMINVIYKRIIIQGFLATDYRDEQNFADFVSTTTSYLRAGQMQVLEDISFGLESIPSAFVGLFCGRNIGKTSVQIAED
ncbi:2-alkenal reductase (NADP(+)-dependent) [Beta vulgaris subsp. vulgaris]|uniref:2-alkenal reductase (NADP(+)-dependent) n=1 Tax=Beta vulgaris subsp. vulgaris TaxID=3555 RepID=UPI0020367FB2|nr:2-alkenal reductase (NADP(+)-dependent) [Beta vulgaris subsp. vulgaris]